MARRRLQPYRALMTNGYPVELDVDYPDRPLNRLTTFFRAFTIIPIAIVLGTVSGAEAWSWNDDSGATDTTGTVIVGAGDQDAAGAHDQGRGGVSRVVGVVAPGLGAGDRGEHDRDRDDRERPEERRQAVQTAIRIVDVELDGIAIGHGCTLWLEAPTRHRSSPGTRPRGSTRRAHCLLQSCARVACGSFWNATAPAWWRAP